MVDQSVSITILIGIGFMFLSLTSIIGVILYKRFLTNTIRVGFISEGGHIERRRYQRKNIKDTIINGNEEYVYNAKAEITTWNGKEMYFFKGNPSPIIFNGNKLNTGNISAENLKAIMETELIAKLFKKDNFNTENILTIVCLILCAISLFMLFMMFNQGVQLKNTPQNVEVMKEIIKQAVASGV